MVRSRILLALFSISIGGALGSCARAAATIGSLSPGGGSILFQAENYSGQTFTVPDGETGLLNATMLSRNLGNIPETGTFYVAPYTPGSVVASNPNYNLGKLGVPLASVQFSVPVGAQQDAITADFNVPVTAGATYAIVLDRDDNSPLPGYSYFITPSSYYSGGAVVYEDNGIVTGRQNTITRSDWDALFQANFGPVPEPSSAGIIAALAATTALRRRRSSLKLKAA